MRLKFITLLRLCLREWEILGIEKLGWLPKAGFPKGIIRLAPASRFSITSSSERLDVWVLIVHTGLPQDRSSVELCAERQGTSGRSGG